MVALFVVGLMAGNVNVYFPGDLGARAKALRINVSAISAAAVRAEIDRLSKRCHACGQTLPVCEDLITETMDGSRD